MTRRITLLAVLALALALGACAKRGAEPEADATAETDATTESESTQASYPSQQVTLRTPIAFASSADVRDAVRDECRLQDKLVRFIKRFSAERNITVEESGSPAGGKVLTVAITDVYAPGGGAFSGGKAVTIEAELTENGQALGDLRARRISGGGAFAAFKGTCDILGRDVETLGRDVSRFLTDPQPGTRMGNL